MSSKSSKQNRHLSQHPCFSRAASRWFERLHLLVAAGCNIKCCYCSRVYDCVNDSAPGVISKIILFREALRKVRNALQKDDRLRVEGVGRARRAACRYQGPGCFK